MGKSKLEVSDVVLEQLIALQHEIDHVSVEQLRQLFHHMIEDLKQADDTEKYRICRECGVLAQEGYVIEACDFYCSEQCLHQHISAEEFDELYADGEGDSYWTDYY